MTDKCFKKTDVSSLRYKEIYYVVIHEGCRSCHPGGIDHISKNRNEAMHAWADAALEWIDTKETKFLPLEQKIKLIKESDQLDYDSDEDDPTVNIEGFSDSYVLIEYQNS